MNTKKMALLCWVVLLVAACAGAPRMSQTERLEWYRANSGEPVRSFMYPGRIWRWTALDDRTMAIWTRSNRGYLIGFFARCPDLSFASSISMSSRAGRVSAGFDSVTVRRLGGDARTSRCRIDTIRPINARVVDESIEEMQDVTWEERDPSVPNEPQ